MTMPGAPLTKPSHGGPYPSSYPAKLVARLLILKSYQNMVKYTYLGTAKVDMCLNKTFLRLEEAHYKNFRVYPAREDKRAKKGATGEWEIW
jgi:hypothetical protein